MSQYADFKVAVPTDREVWIPCGRCTKVTCHTVLTDTTQSESDPESQIDVWDDFLTVQCRGCRSVSFCHESRCSEGVVYDPVTGHESISVERKYYPSRIAGRSEMPRAEILPPGIKGIYSETHAALCNNLRVLAGIGIRAIGRMDRGRAGQRLRPLLADAAAELVRRA
jgi:hypothetical protein